MGEGPYFFSGKACPVYPGYGQGGQGYSKGGGGKGGWNDEAMGKLWKPALAV